jgi:hypothetical protein
VRVDFVCRLWRLAGDRDRRRGLGSGCRESSSPSLPPTWPARR